MNHKNENPKTMPPYPKSLNNRGKLEWLKSWKYLVENQLYSEADLAMLECYCLEMQKYFEFQDKVEQEGCTQISESGYKSAHPLIAAGNTSLKSAMAIGKSFGFSPSSRKLLGISNTHKHESKLTVLRNAMNKKQLN